MTTATVTPSKSGKPAKFRRDHKINWWLTAAVAVLSLTILDPALLHHRHRAEDSGRSRHLRPAHLVAVAQLRRRLRQGQLPEGRAQLRDHHGGRRGAHPADQHLRGLRRGPQHGQALLPLPVLLLHRRHVRAVPGRHAADCEADGLPAPGQPGRPRSFCTRCSAWARTCSSPLASSVRFRFRWKRRPESMAHPRGAFSGPSSSR